jgi:hypothetical protein
MEKIEKKKKVQIPSAVRNIVWNTYIGSNVKTGKCLCCNSEQISYPNFDCGHVISEANGGDYKVQNLRPVCGNCNGSMGTKNMVEFMEVWGIVKPKNWDGIIEKVETSEVTVLLVEVPVNISTSNKICDICYRVFTRPSHLEKHKQKKNPCKGKSKTCKFCNKTFTKHSTLLKHIEDTCKKEKSDFYKEKINALEKDLIKEKQLIDEKLRLITEQR